MITTSPLALLYQTFVQERVYLRGITPSTKKYYEFAWKSLEPYMPTTPESLAKHHIMAAVEDLKHRQSDNSINGYLRALRAFVRWCQAEGHITNAKLRVEQLRTEQPLIKTFTVEHLSRMLHANARTLDDRRIQAMLAVALDTGARIAEILALREADLMLDNLLIRVMGKGRKERLVPISPEGRKRIWAWLKTRTASPDGWLWSTKTGRCITKRNSYRDLKAFAKRCGVTGVRVSWHTFRHTMASNYMENGGNVFYLQAILGHTDLKMTRRYVSIPTQAVASAHAELSSVQRIGK